MPLPLRQFATYILCDLAERTKDKRTDRVLFKGNHISHTYFKPIKVDTETPSAFEERVAQFRSRLPRGSDLTRRLAFAYEALIRSGEKSYSAASLIAELLSKKIPVITIREHAEWKKAGISHKKVKFRIGTTNRNRRTKRKKSCRREIRAAETIRAQVIRFKRNTPQFTRSFEAWFGAYRYQFFRDEEWYLENEPIYRRRLATAETEVGQYNIFTVSTEINLANHLLEQGKFEEAEGFYQSALNRMKLTTYEFEEQRRATEITVMQRIENCRCTLPVCRPATL